MQKSRENKRKIISDKSIKEESFLNERGQLSIKQLKSIPIKVFHKKSQQNLFLDYLNQIQLREEKFVIINDQYSIKTEGKKIS